MDDALTMLKIRALVILAAALLVIQVLFGSFRRRSSSSFVKCLLWAAFTIPGLSVPYAIGLMHATEIQNKLFVVWATFLIIVFGSSSTMSAYQLDDNEHWRIMKFVQLVQIFWAWWLWSIYARELASKDYVRSVVYATPLAILLFLSMFKLSDRFRASQLASLSYGARSDNKLVADYMQSEHEQEAPGYDPVTMKGYRYLVAGEDLNIAEPKPPHYRMKIEKMDRVVTVEKIWQCTGGLLQGPHGNKLRDVCLSFALYKLLRRRYVRYQLAESVLEKTRRFVLDGLLSGENAEERAFRVIERGNREIKLSTAVKKAVTTSLKENGENLRNGSSSLERNGVLDEFRWAFRFHHTHSHTILVWHIATEICMLAKETSEQNPSRPSHLMSFRRCFMYEADDIQVANNLSRYCAYLVAFFPEFLPEHKYTTVSVFDEVVKHLRDSLNGLGRELMVKIEDESKRWKVLADFWAEMVLYLAPSDNTRTHVEHLTRGGEFITHLWALLTHAGILQRQAGSDLV
ncbi:uncharacterized protein A4U43_C03F9670 [Asparagus officinalis]|uniref:DUF4220 domain-containing protein n=1 Tax=Asparagus officinalis TaxID=4686 RepID=A0A5P1FDW4_ASPOF|nr:uncharacterized protein A4U43_C03F9670 [Asparagus officinalis]